MQVLGALIHAGTSARFGLRLELEWVLSSVDVVPKTGLSSAS
jgi:hypothetical protein